MLNVSGYQNCDFLKLWVLKSMVSKIVGTQNCGYLVYGSPKLCGGTHNFMFVCTNISWNSKFMGTCTQNLNFVGTQICGYSKFVGAQNLFILKICRTMICGYSKNCGYSNFLVFILKKLLIHKIWGTLICGYSKFVGTQKLWVFKICDYTKVHVGDRENQNICVLCILCE